MDRPDYGPLVDGLPVFHYRLTCQKTDSTERRSVQPWRIVPKVSIRLLNLYVKRFETQDRSLELHTATMDWRTNKGLDVSTGSPLACDMSRW